LEFRDVAVFVEGGKHGEPGEKPSEQGENQQQTQPTYGTGPESEPGHLGERGALSYHCTIPASQYVAYSRDFFFSRL